MDTKIIKSDLMHVWHPYTQMKDCLKFPPIPIAKAKGIKLYDTCGKFYYDTISSWWCNVHGHNHPAIKIAIKKQLDKFEHVLFAGFTHEPAVELAEKLISIAPKNLTKVFYSDNGSTAVEVAMKMSVQFWQNLGKKNKTVFLSLDMAYHGDTVGAMSVSGDSIFNEKFKSLLFTSFKTPTPYCYRCKFADFSHADGSCRALVSSFSLASGRGSNSGTHARHPSLTKSQLAIERRGGPMCPPLNGCSLECINPMEEILKKHSGRIAAIILEPLLLGAGGMIIYPAEYLARAARLAKKYSVHLILDEVATGFGRTGKMFACGHANVSPDFMCLSKGITSGYLPLGATLTTDKIYKAFYGDYEKLKTFYHGHTYTANPLACAAGVASIDLFKKENTLANVSIINRKLAEFLCEARDFDFVGDTRHIGAVGAIELVKNKRTKEPFGFKERIGYKIYQKGLENNLLLRPLGNVIYFFPPLCTTPRELDDIFARTRRTLQSVTPA